MMRKIFFVIILLIIPVSGFAEINFKAGGNLTFMRAGDANADIPGFYFGVEGFFRKIKVGRIPIGMAFRIRKEGGGFSGPDNGYYLSFAGIYEWQPKVLKRIHRDVLCKIHVGMEVALAHVDYNEFTETEHVRRWTYVNQDGGLTVNYPFVALTAEIPLKRTFFRKREFIVEVGTQINIVPYGIKEGIYDYELGIYNTSIDRKVLRPVLVFFFGMGF